MIENMKRIIENYSEVLKSLQSQLKRFIQLNIDSYNTKLVFENTEPFLTEETLLSRRAPNKEALPNPTDQRLPVLILTPQTCQLSHQL